MLTTLALHSGTPLAGRVLRRMSRHGLRIFRFFSRSLTATPSEPPAGIEVRALTRGEVLSLCGLPNLDLSADRATAAYARGDACFAAFRAGAPLGYCWLAQARLPHLDGLWVEFPRGLAWIYKSLVLESARGRGIAPALYRFAEREALARGCRSAVICVEIHNSGSARAALRAGYAPAGYAAYVAGGRAAWYSPSIRRQGICFVTGSQAGPS